MAHETPHPGKRVGPQPDKARPSQQRDARSSSSPEVVDPIWLLKAAGLAVGTALICGYLTLCFLFYQGQWQLVLHPNRSKPAPTSIAGTPFEIIHFGVDETGLPQLTGWWIPASPQGRYTAKTILYLPSGDGSLADAQPMLAALHGLGINIFAFDYRGYGQSAAMHPNERRMTEDTRSAWLYLTVSRRISGRNVIPFGDGVGAALAARLTASERDIPGVILQSPQVDLTTIVRNDPRVRLLPVRLLFHDSFDISQNLKTLKTPKLFLLKEGSDVLETARLAFSPKVIVTLPAFQANGRAFLEQIDRFVDQLGSTEPRPI